MINIKEYLPFLLGWEPKIEEIRDFDVTRTTQDIIKSMNEKGWFLGAVAAVNNRYVNLKIKAGMREYSLNVEDLYVMGYVNPLKPARKPYVLKYSLAAPESEEGYFVVDYDPVDWEPYYGIFQASIELPTKKELPNGSTVYPQSSTAKLLYFKVARIVVVDEAEFYSSLYRVFNAMLLGKRPSKVTYTEMEKLQTFIRELDKVKMALLELGRR